MVFTGSETGAHRLIIFVFFEKNELLLCYGFTSHQQLKVIRRRGLGLKYHPKDCKTNEPHREKTNVLVSDLVHTNQAVQSQKMARGLKFRISKAEGSFYLCNENKGADQLRGYREADLRLCFRICKTLDFS